mgnify:CR=1 FL=1
MSEQLFIDIAEMKGDIKVLVSKVDACQDAIQNIGQGLGQRVQTHGEKIAQVEVEIKNVKDYASSISKDFKHDVNDRWKWITVCIGLLTLAGLIFKIL